MTKALIGLLVFFSFFIYSCSKDNCKSCTGCKTKADLRLCEDEFEKTSDYNDKVDDMVSDGCACLDD